MGKGQGQGGAVSLCLADTLETTDQLASPPPRPARANTLCDLASLMPCLPAGLTRSWNLINEPRCKYCGTEAINSWVGEMAAHLKVRRWVTLCVDSFWPANPHASLN